MGLIAGPVLITLAIVRFYAGFRDNRYVESAFLGLRATVLALIMFAVIRLSRTAIVDVEGVAVFAGILAGLYFFRRKRQTVHTWPAPQA